MPVIKQYFFIGKFWYLNQWERVGCKKGLQVAKGVRGTAVVMLFCPFHIVAWQRPHAVYVSPKWSFMYNAQTCINILHWGPAWLMQKGFKVSYITGNDFPSSENRSCPFLWYVASYEVTTNCISPWATPGFILPSIHLNVHSVMPCQRKVVNASSFIALTCPVLALQRGGRMDDLDTYYW